MGFSLCRSCQDAQLWSTATVPPIPLPHDDAAWAEDRRRNSGGYTSNIWHISNIYICIYIHISHIYIYIYIYISHVSIYYINVFIENMALSLCSKIGDSSQLWPFGTRKNIEKPWILGFWSILSSDQPILDLPSGCLT